MLNTDLINIVANLFLGMSILGTIIVIFLFLIFKIFKINKLTKVLPTLCIIFCISWALNIACNIYLLFSTPTKGIETVKKGVVKNIKPGTVMLDKDEEIPAKDYTIDISTKDSQMEILLWDFAAEDSDSIQLLVDGKSIATSVDINHNPQTFKVPTKGTIEIKGLKDGGSSITYALYVSETKETYFNTTIVDSSNIYTIKNKKN